MKTKDLLLLVLRDEIEMQKRMIARLENIIKSAEQEDGVPLVCSTVDHPRITPGGSIRRLDLLIEAHLNDRPGLTSVDLANELFRYEYGIDRAAFKRRVQVQLNEMGSRGRLSYRRNYNSRGYLWYPRNHPDTRTEPAHSELDH